MKILDVVFIVFIVRFSTDVIIFLQKRCVTKLRNIKQKSKNYQNILTILANSCKILMIKGFLEIQSLVSRPFADSLLTRQKSNPNTQVTFRLISLYIISELGYFVSFLYSYYFGGVRIQVFFFRLIYKLNSP